MPQTVSIVQTTHRTTTIDEERARLIQQVIDCCNRAIGASADFREVIAAAREEGYQVVPYLQLRVVRRRP